MENTYCFMCQEPLDKSKTVVRSGYNWCNPCSKEQDFYNDIMHESMIEEQKFLENNKRINDRLFKAILSLKGEPFTSDLKEYAKSCEVHGSFRIVRKPQGGRQSESFGKIKKAWVDQYSTGDSGDSYYGTVSVKIKKGRWLEMPFAC